MKKFFSLVLALVMALSLTTVAWGASVDPCTGTCTHEAAIGTTHYDTLAEAVTVGGTVTLLSDVTLAAPITVAAGNTVVLDLNGHTISGTDTTSANYGLININPGATLTINDSVGTGTITLSATTNSGWNRYSSVISNQRGTLIVNGGTIEHKGGTDMSYAIDNLTNTGAEPAKTTINGGVIKSAYIGIRQFCNSTTGNNALEINGGTIEGAKRSVWMQNPNDKVNDATLTITDGTFVGAVTVGIDDFDVAISGGTFDTDVSAYVVDGYTVVQNTDGTYILIVDAAGSSTDALYDLKQADAKGTEVAGDVGYKVVAGEKNEATGSGVLEYIVMDGKLFVKIAKKDATTSDFYVTKANEKTPLFYMSQIDSPADVAYEFIAKEFNKFGVKCDQMNVPYAFTAAKLGAYVWTNPVTGDKIYFLEDDEDFDYSVFAEPYINGTTGAGPLQILVDDEIVVAWMLVDGNDDPADPLNQHIWAPVAYDKTTPTKAQCGLCGAKANLYKDGKAPAGSDVIDVEFDRIPYDLVITSTGSIGTAVTTPSTDKVTSAETFDAGIAMYVGMSVMAAAGSAVVLKKRED